LPASVRQSTWPSVRWRFKLSDQALGSALLSQASLALLCSRNELGQVVGSLRHHSHATAAHVQTAHEPAVLDALQPCRLECSIMKAQLKGVTGEKVSPACPLLALLVCTAHLHEGSNINTMTSNATCLSHRHYCYQARVGARKALHWSHLGAACMCLHVHGAKRPLLAAVTT
jgi:hypothetical protein